MRRVEIIDSYRGIAILAMILLHGSYYWQRNFSIAEYNHYLQNPFAMVGLIFGKLAGIFAVITGMAYAFSAMRKVDAKGKTAKQILKSTTFSGFWIVIISKIQSVIFNHTLNGNPMQPFPIGPNYYSVITGSIQTKSLHLPSHYLIFYRTTALFLIGISAIWTGIILSVLFRDGGHTKHRRNFIVLGVVGTVIITMSQWMQQLFHPYWVDCIIHDRILAGMVVGIFVGDPYPFFPVAGYTTYGIMFGLAFYLGIRRLYVTLIGGFASIAYLGTGITMFSILGTAKITNIFEPPDAQLNYVLIGIMLAFSVLIYNIHCLNSENRIRKAFHSLFLRRFGLMTLTIFMLEPLLGVSIKTWVLDPLLGTWSTSIVWVMIYSVGLIIIWYQLIKFWEKHNFAYTWEWINAKVIQKLTGQPTMRMAIKENLYATDELVSAD